ncbi:hypothetical protein BGZ47_000385 [Haplosporangium gracile]|nr:hypothetical protein BGZ47_000385 [Haplosporangium gracile]
MTSALEARKNKNYDRRPADIRLSAELALVEDLDFDIEGELSSATEQSKLLKDLYHQRGTPYTSSTSKSRSNRVKPTSYQDALKRFKELKKEADELQIVTMGMAQQSRTTPSNSAPSHPLHTDDATAPTWDSPRAEDYQEKIDIGQLVRTLDLMHVLVWGGTGYGLRTQYESVVLRFRGIQNDMVIDRTVQTEEGEMEMVLVVEGHVE